MNARQILIAAKALIPDERHWWRGPGSGPGSGIGCYCSVTAANATARAHATQEEIDVALDLLEVQISMSIARWNDAPERTLAEVHAAFDRAIEATAS